MWQQSPRTTSPDQQRVSERTDGPNRNRNQTSLKTAEHATFTRNSALGSHAHTHTRIANALSGCQVRVCVTSPPETRLERRLRRRRRRRQRRLRHRSQHPQPQPCFALRYADSCSTFKAQAHTSPNISLLMCSQRLRILFCSEHAEPHIHRRVCVRFPFPNLGYAAAVAAAAVAVPYSYIYIYICACTCAHTPDTALLSLTHSPPHAMHTLANASMYKYMLIGLPVAAICTAHCVSSPMPPIGATLYACQFFPGKCTLYVERERHGHGNARCWCTLYARMPRTFRNALSQFLAMTCRRRRRRAHARTAMGGGCSPLAYSRVDCVHRRGGPNQRAESENDSGRATMMGWWCLNRSAMRCGRATPEGGNILYVIKSRRASNRRVLRWWVLINYYCADGTKCLARSHSHTIEYVLHRCAHRVSVCVCFVVRPCIHTTQQHTL